MSDLAADTGGHPAVAWWRAAAVNGSGIALAVGSLFLLWLLVEPLVLVLIAIVIAQALMPIVGWLERWLPRAIATVAVYLVLVAMVAGLGWLMMPILIEQARMLAENAPGMLQQAREWIDGTGALNSDQVLESAQSLAQRLSEWFLTLPLLVFNSFLDTILVIFMSIYWIIAAPSLHRFVLSLFPEHQRDRADGVMQAMGHTMGGYVRGTVIDAAIIGTLTYIGLTVIGLEYALVLAVLSGFGELIPVVGPILAAIPAALVALADSPQQALIVIIFFVVLQQVESNLVLPLVMRHQADVPPLLSLVAVTAGSALGGLLGAVIAIPLVGALRIMVVRVLAPAERDWTGVEDAPTDVGVAPDDAEGGAT